MPRGCSMNRGWMVHAQRMLHAQQMVHAQGMFYGLKDAPCLRADPLPRIKKDAQEGFGALKRNGCSMCKGCVIHAQGMVYG